MDSSNCKLHHKNTQGVPARADAAHLLTHIQAFLESCRNPAVLEQGEEIVLLRPGEYALEIRSERLWIEAWCDTRTVSRRILSIERRAVGTLECSIHRFGGSPGRLTFLDLDRPQTAYKTLTGARQNFAEQFRRMLHRQFPAWDIRTLTTGMDLQRSFSPVFPRARLVQGSAELAVFACPSAEDEDHMLAFALIWHRHLVDRARAGTRVGLALFLPETAGVLTAHRLHWLDRWSMDPRIFRFNRHGSAGEVDIADLGNLAIAVRCSDRMFDRVVKDGSERGFELAVRGNVAVVDARLMPRPVHSQVFALAGRDRDLIDLLAVTAEGRVAILELKISEDVQLPIQALDYWMRINRHVLADELQHLFPAVPLTREKPLLMLVSPANSFHSSNAAVLGYFSREIEVERVGIASNWQREFRVVLRLRGADVPLSHKTVGEASRY